MAELATIARPYAEALFETCRGDAAGTQGWLDTLAAACATPQLLQFAADPKVQAGEIFKLLTSVLIFHFYPCTCRGQFFFPWAYWSHPHDRA